MDPSGTLDPERRQALCALKLTALVAGQWPEAVLAPPGPFPGGAAVTEPGTGRGWLLCQDGSPAGLGAALVWAQRGELRRLHLVVDGQGVNGVPVEVMARRAAAFRDQPVLWTVEGRTLRRVDPAPAHDAGLATGAPGLATPMAAGAAAWAEVMIAHGVEPVVEHGVLRGEVLGLEVARLTGDEEAGWSLAVGVGDHDRQARQQTRPDEDPATALDQVVELVRARRAPGARRHPANVLAPERWLRTIVVSRPSLVGAAHLVSIAPPLARGDLRGRAPAPAAGSDEQGGAVVVVCSTGIDVDLVPSAADSRLLYGRGARLVLAVPVGDDHPVTRGLAAALCQPAEVVTVARDWVALTPTGPPGEA